MNELRQNTENSKHVVVARQGLLYLDGRNSQKYLHQDQAYF